MGVAGIRPVGVEGGRIEDAEASTPNEVGMRLIGEPNAWGNIRVRGVVKSASVPIPVIYDLTFIGSPNSAADGINGVEIEVSLLIVPLCGCALNLLADAEIQCKSWNHFPVVLQVNPVVILAGRGEGDDSGAAVPSGACPCGAVCGDRSEKERP